MSTDNHASTFQLFYGGEQHGPYTLGQIRSMWANGVITADACYWTGEREEWRPVGEILTARTPIHWGVLHWGVLLRDIGIVFVLSCIGGLIVGASNPYGTATEKMAGMVIANIFSITGGFVIVGCLTKENRWAHLVRVAVGAWLTGLLGVVFGITTVLQWLGGVVVIFLFMGLGGWISSFLSSRRQPTPSDVVPKKASLTAESRPPAADPQKPNPTVELWKGALRYLGLLVLGNR